MRFGVVKVIDVATIASLLAFGGRASAGVTLGASFAYTHLSSAVDIDHVTSDVVGIPSTEDWSQPGIRVGYSPFHSNWGLIADLGLLHRSGTVGITRTAFEILPLLQVNALHWGNAAAFLDGGVGLEHETGFASSANRAVLGGGVGARTAVSDGHGFIRAELRYAYLPKREIELNSFSSDLYPATSLFSVILGFDLMVAR